MNSQHLFESDPITEFIQRSLQEDIGSGDHSSLASIPSGTRGRAQMLIKQPGILAGVDLAKRVFLLNDPDLRVETLIQDGSSVQKGDRALTVEGSVHSILRTERLVLNLAQRLSGIATTTKHITELVAGTNCRILDTRKTTPGLRSLEKWAVTMGGAHNHRFGLFDMIMLKDNNVDYAGGIIPAVERTKAYLKENNLDLKIEVETRDLKEVKEVLEVGGVDRIMLDNFTPDDIRVALELINGQAETEASGGITLDTVRVYAETGVDFISIGALTHSVKSLDISLKEF